jgi:hypothetical protein
MDLAHPPMAEFLHRFITKDVHTPSPVRTCANGHCPHNSQPLLLRLNFSLFQEQKKNKLGAKLGTTDASRPGPT